VAIRPPALTWAHGVMIVFQAMGLRDMDKIYFLSHRFSDFITPCAQVKARLGLTII